MIRIKIVGGDTTNRPFNKSFFSCVALINGEEVAQIDFKEGSGHDYEDAIIDELIKMGYMSSLAKSIKRYCEANGITYYATHSDVNRKSNL